MNTPVSDLLDRLAPDTKVTPDWNDVLRRADIDADPVGSSFRRWPHRLAVNRRRLAALAVLVAVIGATAALLPGRLGHNGDSGFLQNALAAVSGGPVLHVVLEQPLSDSERTQGSNPVFEVVDLSTGRSRPVMNQLELWYDPSQGLEHAVGSVDGTVGSDELVRGRTAVVESRPGRVNTITLPKSSGASGFLGGLDAFFLGYKHALATGAATRAGSGTFDGHPVEWLRFTSPSSPGENNTEEVAVDQRTYKAVAIRGVCPRRCIPPTAETIKTIEGISATDADFTPPTAHPQIRVAQYGDGKRQERQGNLTGASTYLGQATFWAGPTVGGSRFSGTRFARPVTYSSAALNPGPASVIARGRGVTFYYGTTGAPDFNAQPGQAYISIAETANVGFSFYGFNMQTLGLAGQPLTAAGTAIPPEGELVLSYTGTGGDWTGQTRKGRIDIEIEAPSRTLVIRAAQTLLPTPRSGTTR